MTKEYLIPEKYLKEIDNFLSNDKKRVTFGRFIKYVSPEFKLWLDERNIPSSIIGYIHKNHLTKITIPNCPTCGKEISFTQIINGGTFCSRKCQSLSTDIQEKRKETNIQKYGVEYPLQNESIYKKLKQTSKKRYGVENASKSKIIKEKTKETCLKKYGVENPNQCESVKNKAKTTNYNKYGVENPFQAEICKEKIKQTNLEKYGVENPNQCKEIKQKIKETNRSKFWNTFCSNLKKKGIIPLFGKNEYVEDTGRKFKCLICGKEFESEGTCNYEKIHTNKDGSYTTLSTHHIFCPSCSFRFSKKEKEVLEYVKSIYKGEVLENNRKILDGKELDIYLPSLNLAIEFDGDYWHSLETAQERDKEKDSLCEQKGITLFRIKESEWDSDKTLVESKISAIISRCEN